MYSFFFVIIECHSSNAANIRFDYDPRNYCQLDELYPSSVFPPKFTQLAAAKRRSIH